ncbi:MAG: FAD-dependent oxidoreductase [Calditerrivibrio sp.]|nr:FAD-dependent oxidoreductase [Calditerrivibrio sp.]
MKKKILVIGGVAAGASAAAKARRIDEDAQITILEKNGYISFANCGMPYYIGDVIKNRSALLFHNEKSFKKRFNIDVYTKTTAYRIDSKQKLVYARKNEEELIFPYDKLILCNGAKTVIPEIEGIETVPYFTLRSIEDMDNIKSYIIDKSPKSATIIGAGYIGIETAEALVNCNLNVSIVEALPNILPTFSQEISEKIYNQMILDGVKVYTNTKVVKASLNNQNITLTTDSGFSLDTDLLIISTGVKPDIELAMTAGIEIGDLGGVRVNEKMETSVVDIYAAGDLVEKKNIVTQRYCLAPLAGPANREGKVAGCNAAGGHMVYSGTLRTAIVSFGPACCAQTGLSYEEAIKNGFDADFVYTEDPHHVEYYPTAKYIFIKLIFDKKTGKILGAQASGEIGVERRIDIISTAIYANLTVYDLEKIDFCYSPPFGSAKDPANIAASVAANLLRGVSYIIKPQIFLQIIQKQDDIQILDVRTRLEYKTIHVKNAINIYVNDLRESLHLLNNKSPIYVYCAVGYRGHIATKMLRNLGFEAYNVSGGIESIKRIAKIQNMEVFDGSNT